MVITVCSIVCRSPVRFVSRFRKSIWTTSGSIFVCVTFGTAGVFRFSVLLVTGLLCPGLTCRGTCGRACGVGGSGRERWGAARRPCAPERLHPSEHGLSRDDRLHVFSRSDTALAARAAPRCLSVPMGCSSLLALRCSRDSRGHGGLNCLAVTVGVVGIPVGMEDDIALR